MLMTRNVSTNSLLRYRLALGFTLFFFFYFYQSYRNELTRVIQISGDSVKQCHEHSDSLLSKLKVVNDYKNVMEKKLKSVSEGQQKQVDAVKSSLTNCQLDLQQAKKLQQEPKKSEADQTNLTAQVQLLSTHLDQLTTKMKEQDDKIIELMEKLKLSETSLNSCQETVKQHVGVLPVAQYTQNETASFNRHHKADEALSFDRGNIEVHNPNVLLKPKELVAKLQEHEAEKDVHPDDRKKNDDYVNEVPNEKEEDYKEGGGPR